MMTGRYRSREIIHSTVRSSFINDDINCGGEGGSDLMPFPDERKSNHTAACNFQVKCVVYNNVAQQTTVVTEQIASRNS